MYPDKETRDERKKVLHDQYNALLKERVKLGDIITDIEQELTALRIIDKLVEEE